MPSGSSGTSSQHRKGQLTVSRALGPIQDGWVVPLTDTAAFTTGQVQRVPLIVGSNSDEGRASVKDWPIHTVAAMRD